MVEDPAIAPRLKRAPAAMTMHHAYIGGLLEHVVSLIGLASAVAAHYPELDADLLLCRRGASRYRQDRRAALRARDRLLRRRAACSATFPSARAWCATRSRASPGFPAPLATLVQHLILSHHGSYEFGSPSLPQIPEAVALHFIDDLDSKMGAVRATLGRRSGVDAVRAVGPSAIRACVAPCFARKPCSLKTARREPSEKRSCAAPQKG